MHSPDDLYRALALARQEMAELRILASRAISDAIEAKVAAENAVKTSKALMAEVDRLLTQSPFLNGRS